MGKKSAGAVTRWLNAVERVGNSLPHPVTLFALFSLATVVLSAICAGLGVSAEGNLISGGMPENTRVTAVSLLTREGLAFMLTGAVSNFTGYAPLGMVLTAMLGVGVAERSGLMEALLKNLVRITPAKLLTPMIVFLGVMSNVASDAGYVILLPLGAMLFGACGRHPLAGLAAAFSGVSGGFSANLLVGTLDPMLSGITQTAVELLDPDYRVQVMGNYIFLVASTFLITVLGTAVTERIVEPRLGAYSGSNDETAQPAQVTPLQKRGLKYALAAALVFAGIIVACCIPSDSFFRGPDGALLGDTPLMDSLVVLIALVFFIPGVTYGLITEKFRSDKDVAAALASSMSDMGSFLALAFVSAQFIQFFSYSRLGTILALSGAELFRSLKIGMIPTMVIFVLLCAVMNLFMGSASAKWSILAPVFVPMFMLLGYSPELCQLAYRVGDSCTNVITPLMTYYSVVLVYFRRYDPRAGIGTVTAAMLPYSACFLVGWTLMLVLWLLLGLPIGWNTPLSYPAL